jgi:hypothetical protein
MNKENEGLDSEIDLLSHFKVKPKWIPGFMYDAYSWKISSGKWEFKPLNKIICLSKPGAKFGENLSIFGFRDWRGYALEVRFKYLSESIRPPEGGAILYFLFRNTKNYYSIHYCLFKQKIEFIKRYQGVWNTLGARSYNFKTQEEYTTTIHTHSGFHHCQIEGSDLMKIHDEDISKGCIGIGAKYCDIEFSHISLSLHSDHL